MTMEHDVQEIKKELSEVRQDVKQLLVIGTENKVSLDAHMKRTELNENRIEKLEYWLLGALLAIILKLIFF